MSTITDTLRSNWAVMISGTGSNLSALLDLDPVLSVGLVISDKKNAYGLSRARRRGIPTYHFENNDWDDLQNQLKRYLIDYIFLAGFMKICPENFLKNWSGRIFNVHPSLLPTYPGLKSIERSFNDKAPMGVTIHEVTPAVDKGLILLQRKIVSTDTLESSEFQIHISEHRVVRRVFECYKK